MRKLYTFLTVLFLASTAWMTVDAAIVKGKRAYFSDLKAGDSLLFHNAMCDVGNPSRGTNGALQWLNGNKFTSQNMVVEIPTFGFTEDFVFILEKAPNSPISGNPTFYLRNAASGKYLYQNTTSTAYTTSDKTQATWVEPADARKWNRWYLEPDHKNWAFETHLADDSTMVFLYQPNKNTTYYFGPFWNYGYTYFGSANDITIWNVYYVAHNDSPVPVITLEALYSRLQYEAYQYIVGDQPGMYRLDAVENLILELERIGFILDFENPDEATRNTLLEELTASYKAVIESQVKINDSYYHIISANTSINGGTKALYVDSQSKLRWGTLDEKAGKFVFHIVPLPNGNYTIQNLASGEYLNTAIDADGNFTDAENMQVGLTAEPQTSQTITAVSGVQAEFNLSNIKNTRHYNTQKASTGDNIVCTKIKEGIDNETCWSFVEITDQERIDSMRQEGARQLLVDGLQLAFETGAATLKKACDYTGDFTTPRDLIILAPKATSEFYSVKGMREACNNLKNVLIAAFEMEATQVNIDSITTATLKVESLYVDRDALDAELASTITEGENLYKKILGTDNKLITRGDQMSSNSRSEPDYATYEHLIDGLTHYNYNFHSIWNGTGMQAETITAAEWLGILKGLDASKYEYHGIGYHNLQICLDDPVDKFHIEYIGRSGTGYTDTPNKYAIYVTNDKQLGTNPDMANLDKWTYVQTVNANLQDVEEAKHVSPIFQLDKKYKYVRFVVLGTTHQGKVAARTFNNPEITGITWNLGEFQMFAQINPENLQYNYDPEMKTAADALRTILDNSKTIKTHSMVNTDKIDALKAAIEKVNTLYADTTELVNRYDIYKTIAKNAKTGSGLGFVDANESITAFASALDEAKTTVSSTRPTKPQINSALEAMQEAYGNFVSHIQQPQPGKWYCVTSGANISGTTGQPIYLEKNSTGDRLHTGDYNLGKLDPTTDPFAIWRLVPIEGTNGQYAIQNLGTGHYFGNYRGDGYELCPVSDNQPIPYVVEVTGNGFFRLSQADLYQSDPYNALICDNFYSTVINDPQNTDQQQYWAFEEIPADNPCTLRTLASNSINIITLPFAIDDTSVLTASGEEVATFGIKNLVNTDNGATLQLYNKTSVEAGEPFILQIGNYKETSTNKAKAELTFPLPTDITTQASKANGLIGTLDGITVYEENTGYFEDNILKATTGSLFFPGGTGYIDPTQVKNLTDQEVALTITSQELVGLKKLLIQPSYEFVNVYTLDGRMLKRNVRATEATKGLGKGIYLIGKKKIAIN